MVRFPVNYVVLEIENSCVGQKGKFYYMRFLYLRESTKKPQISDNRRNYVSQDPRQKSSRGRGRGPKVFVQSEGTFLGEGPALKTKKGTPVFEN